MDKPVALGAAQLVRLHGTDARRFAHAQFCSDVESLVEGDWQWSAWLDAKGRVRTFFALAARSHDDMLAWLPLGDAAAMATELRRFVFRSKLTIEPVSGWQLRGHFDVGQDSPRFQQGDAGISLRLDGAQPRRIELLSDASTTVDADALRLWRGQDVADGLPLIDASCADEFVPQALDLERLGAISFRKGCYPGQEIAARLHFRGGNKRRLRSLRWSPGAGAASIGMLLHDDGDSGSAAVGRLLYQGIDADGPIGLAVINDALPTRVAVRLGDAIQARLQPL